jgi:hypothetical protein
MGLLVVENACTQTADGSQGVIVIESDCDGPPFTEAFQELESADARRLAQSFAQKAGIAPAHINGNVLGPYPVNFEGLSLEHVKDGKGKPLPASDKRMQPARYRVDVPVIRPFR